MADLPQGGMTAGDAAHQSSTSTFLASRVRAIDARVPSLRQRPLPTKHDDRNTSTFGPPLPAERVGVGVTG
jgi:hypothetical protein